MGGDVEREYLDLVKRMDAKLGRWLAMQAEPQGVPPKAIEDRVAELERRLDAIDAHEKNVAQGNLALIVVGLIVIAALVLAI